MTRFIVVRLGQACVVLLLVSVLTFILVRLLPGGPVQALLGTHNTPGAAAALEQKLGLDQPLVIQYATWVGDLLRGDLGFSYVRQSSVTSLIAASLPNSMLLGAMAFVMALLVAIPLGVFQALHPNSWSDFAATTAAFVLYSMPIFFIGALAILYLSVYHPVFPPGGVGPAGVTDLSWGTRLYYAFMPATVLALVQLAVWSRYVRSSMLETLAKDYIRTSRAQGLSMGQTVRQHGLRNASVPVIQLIGLSLPALIGGVVVVESVFNYPGMGYLLWQGAIQYDFPVILGVTVIAGLAVVLGTLAADLLHTMVDPRVRDGIG